MKTLKEMMADLKIDEDKQIKDTVRELMPLITKARNEGYNLPQIFKELQKKGLKTTLNNFRKLVMLYNKEKNEKRSCKNIILFANDKGGVGKTTIASLLELNNEIILNLDSTRIIKDIFPYKEVIDFHLLKKAENIDLEDYLVSLIENSPYENIIIDTKGGLSEELKISLNYATSIVVPIKIGDLSETASYDFIYVIKNYLDSLKRNIKWAIVYNEISSKFLIKKDIKQYDFVPLIQDAIQLLKDILGQDLKVVTYFKRSETITTREITKKDIDDLLEENFSAYLPAWEEIQRLNKDLKHILCEG